MRRSSGGSRSIKAGSNIEIASTGDNAINVVNRFQFGSDSYPDAPPTAMHLPPEIAGFTGRERELTEVVRLLDPAAATKVPVSAVAGPPGVGKTALAIQAGHAARDRNWFPAGTFFIDLHGYDDAPIEPLQALGTLLRGLGLAAERIPPEIDERMRLYASVLAGQSAPLRTSSRLTPLANALSLSFFFTDSISKSRMLFDGRTYTQAVMKPVNSSHAKSVCSSGVWRGVLQ